MYRGNRIGESVPTLEAKQRTKELRIDSSDRGDRAVGDSVCMSRQTFDSLDGGSPSGRMIGEVPSHGVKVRRPDAHGVVVHH